MRILIIYSNHYGDNFNSRLLERLKSKIAHSGDEFIVRDLYQMNFDPVLRTKDFEMISSGNPPDDIKKEQELIRWADILLFIYPIWWGGMPAIVKGYIDRVFSWGFAYKSNGNGPYPLLTDKKAILMNSFGQSRAEYEMGMFTAMNRVNSEGVFGFSGIEVLHQLYFPSIHTVSEEVQEAYIAEAEKLMLNLELAGV
ncbi:MAG: NAD(P)H-dependent oxidoreductase [Bacteroidales bacterium]|nr:NAD(P)H-dependent oxidoreductase [Bacteroidales bacterium]